MQYKKYRVTEKYDAAEKTTIIRVMPVNPNDFLSFKAGQYVYLKNPSSVIPDEEHPFSLASSPTDTTLEFCIKNVGDWTEEISKLPEQSPLLVSEAQGNFIWEDTITNVVFLIGGLGIAPVMSLLRYLKDTKKTSPLTLLYGSQTPDFVPYKKELETMIESLPLKLIYIYSHLPEDSMWVGYRGFITEEILQKEIEFSKNPDFFVVGPPIFITQIQTELRNLSVPDSKFHTEHLIPKK